MAISPRALAPVAAAGLMAMVVLVALAWRREFFTRDRLEAHLPAPRVNPVLLGKAVAAALGMVLFFFLGQPPAKVAIIAGSLLLLTRRLKPERVYREIDWALLLLFCGLFIVVAGMEKALLGPQVLAYADRLDLGSPAVMAAVAAVLSNLVSNVPAVLVLKPFVEHLASPRLAWLSLAMAATLAGNFTLLGSVANLIVVQRARRHGVTIGFWSYFRLGAPVTVVTIAIGVWMLG